MTITYLYGAIALILLIVGLCSPLFPQTECPPATQGPSGERCVSYACVLVDAEYATNVASLVVGSLFVAATLAALAAHAYTKNIVIGIVAMCASFAAWMCVLIGGPDSMPFCPHGELFWKQCALNCTFVPTIPTAHPRTLSTELNLLALAGVVATIAITSHIDDGTRRASEAAAAAAAAADAERVAREARRATRGPR